MRRRSPDGHTTCRHSVPLSSPATRTAERGAMPMIVRSWDRPLLASSEPRGRQVGQRQPSKGIPQEPFDWEQHTAGILRRYIHAVLANHRVSEIETEPPRMGKERRMEIGQTFAREVERMSIPIVE